MEAVGRTTCASVRRVRLAGPAGPGANPTSRASIRAQRAPGGWRTEPPIWWITCSHSAPTTGSGRCRSRAGCASACSATRRWSRRYSWCSCETSAVTAIQLAGSFVNANLDFHTLVPEGVWHEQPDGSVAFHPLPPPTDEDVEVLAVRIVRRVARLLARRDADAAVDDALDALDQAQAEAVQLPMTCLNRGPGQRRHRRRRDGAARSSTASPFTPTPQSMPPTVPRSSGSRATSCGP